MPVREYVFGHSLINHASDTPATAVPWWMNAFANAAGDSYAFTGQYGFLTGHDNGGPTAQWGFAGIRNPWNEEGGASFGSANFTHITITAGNFIQYQPPDAPYYNEPGTTPISATLTIIDRALAAEPGARIVIYENWPDMAPFVQGWPPSREEFGDYVRFMQGDFHRWWLDYVDALQSARPNADIVMVEVGPILGELLTDPGLGLTGIPLTDLFSDNAPHGTPSLYFLAALIHFTALYGTTPPESFRIPDSVHPAISANFEAILSFIDTRVDIEGASASEAPVDPPSTEPDPIAPDPVDSDPPPEVPVPPVPEPSTAPPDEPVPDTPVVTPTAPVVTPTAPPLGPAEPLAVSQREASSLIAENTRTVSGTEGDDFISRAAVEEDGIGDKLIVAGSGHDVIVDGQGQDTIIGGAGSDFISLWSDDGLRDVIVGFSPGEDILDLNAQGVSSLDQIRIQPVWNNTAVMLDWGSDGVILHGLWDTVANRSLLTTDSIRFAPAGSQPASTLRRTETDGAHADQDAAASFSGMDSVSATASPWGLTAEIPEQEGDSFIFAIRNDAADETVTEHDSTLVTVPGLRVDATYKSASQSDTDQLHMRFDLLALAGCTAEDLAF
ncbi:hypothetical protein [Cognatishimia sp. F0-27]|uniref:hypothetical protein n=1 Tax=Cognatishimia sp. F0-27 TaxID=2816855 RepID=UPI001D0C86AF|nr:hypothetical protein [Cognatishimia sp. F0-27]MCC1494999.1 hypothetical protein [Cognatishimia sp. F0-27]